MRSKLMTLAGALALLAVLGKFYAKPLFAQVRAALVQNVDEPGRRPYQALATINPGHLGVAFPMIPTGQRLVVKQLTVTTAPAASFGSFYLSVAGTVVFQGSILEGTNLWSDRQLSASLTAFVEGGQSPSVGFTVVPDDAFPVRVVLIGYLVDCSATGSCAPIAP